jgi:hypothetical protein
MPLEAPVTTATRPRNGPLSVIAGPGGHRLRGGGDPTALSEVASVEGEKFGVYLGPL